MEKNKAQKSKVASGLPKHALCTVTCDQSQKLEQSAAGLLQNIEPAIRIEYHHQKSIIPARDPKQWGGEKEARLVVVMMMTMTHR